MLMLHWRQWGETVDFYKVWLFLFKMLRLYFNVCAVVWRFYIYFLIFPVNKIMQELVKVTLWDFPYRMWQLPVRILTSVNIYPKLCKTNAKKRCHSKPLFANQFLYLLLKWWCSSMMFQTHERYWIIHVMQFNDFNSTIIQIVCNWGDT